MNIDEIFNKIVTHMLEGMMMHEQLANYFNFLSLEGYQYCHDYHYLEETISHRDIQKYFLDHYNKLIPESQPNVIQVIPSNWYKYKKENIDIDTKQEGIRKGFLAWNNWEFETKKLYENCYNELINMNEIAAAEVVRSLVVDVDEELAELMKIYFNILAVNFDLTVLVPEQKEMKKNYLKKMKKIVWGK